MDDDRRLIMEWLREEDASRLDILWSMADSTRKEYVGDAVHLRGLIEISNSCVRQCSYCGMRAGNSGLERYRMTADEIMACVREVVRLGYGTVVLQGGEDYGLSTGWVESLITRIKSETSLAVTLSLGERSEGDLAAWKKAGADRYLLRFETSDTALYGRIHPPLSSKEPNRLMILETLKTLGYQAGSGIMIGIPGQSYASVADDILVFRTLDLDMIGVGPFIPHPGTPLGDGEWKSGIPSSEQVPNSELMSYKVIALTRLYCPEANIPSTTALATLNPSRGYELGLARGANVVMPNLTPFQYRTKYDVYPKKVCFSETASSIGGLHDRIRSIGRTIGEGPGERIRRTRTVPVGRVSLG